MQYDIVDTHINHIMPGDTIVHNGELKTVCKNNIKHCHFFGKSLFGDSYHSGHKPVKRAIILKAMPSPSSITMVAEG